MMVIFIPTATALSPFNWPMFTDPGFQSKTADFYLEDALSDPETNYEYIPSLYTSSSVKFKIDFTGKGEEGDVITIKSTEFVSGPSYETQLTYSNAGVVQGNVSGLEGESYRFLMPNGTVRTLPTSTTEKWLSVVQWIVPQTPWEKVNTYNFKIVYDLQNSLMPENNIVNAVATTQVKQYVYWHWEPALNVFSNLVSIGR
jgi:hypothetical protein